MKKVRLGVIGCGVIGQSHAILASSCEAAELVALADIDDTKRQATAQKFNVAQTHVTGEALIDDPQVEAVVLAMPASARAALAKRAFAKGKHVLTEKPVAMNAREVEDMLSAQGSCVAACCSSRFQFFEHTQAVRKFFATGALGNLRLVRCRASNPAGGPPDCPPIPWRLRKAANGGGIMMNWGCYDLDYLLGLTGWTLKPRLVLARTWRVPPKFESHIAPNSDAETHLAALVQCEGGAVIQYERGEYMPAQAEFAWEIIGDDGSLRLTMIRCEAKKIVFYKAVTEKGVVPETIWEGEEDGAREGNVVADFALAILEKRPPMTDLRKALVVQKITDAIYQSSDTNKAVEV